MSDSLTIHPENIHHNVLVPNGIAASSFMEWIRKYLEGEVYGIQSKHTLEAKVRDIYGFTNWFAKLNGHCNIEDWHARDTQAYLSHLEKLGRTASTINRIFASLRRLARWIHDQPNSPFRNGLPTKNIKQIAVDEPDCKKLSQRDIHRLFKAADNLVLTDTRTNARPRRNRAVLTLLYFTGLRVSELTALNFNQYDGKYLGEVRRKGKTRNRAVYLSSECRRMLDDYLTNERAKDDPNGVAVPLFLSSRTQGYLGRDQIFRILTHIADEANKHTKDNPIHIHPHRLRHTFGAEFREKSGSDTETQQALGHVSLKYVGRYVRKSQEEREDLMEKIGKI